ANLGNFFRVIYMIVDPMNVNHAVPKFWENFFGSFSLPWSIMTWLFLAVKYNEILFASISKNNEDIEKDLDRKFFIVMGIVSILFIPQMTVCISIIFLNYQVQRIAHLVNTCIYAIS